VKDEELQEKVGNIIDELVVAVKKTSRQIFDLMVERTADTADELVDKGVETLKKKIDKEGDTNETQKE